MSYTGFIYVIKSPSLDTVYYGSTKKPLITRFNEHKSNYMRYLLNDQLPYCSSFTMFKNNDAYIDFVEEVKCNSRLELEARESHYIKSFNCCNKYKPFVMSEGYTSYYSKNRDKIIQYRKEKVECECGAVVRRGDFHRHKKSHKHFFYSKLLNPTVESSTPVVESV
jgi:hypothetical protein